MSRAERLLVVGPSWVGDMVIAQSLFRSLLAAEPETCIDVVAPGWSLPLIERMPEVRRAFELSVGHGELGLRARRALGRRLRAEAYDRAIVLPRSAKAALVPWFASIPRRTGFRGELRYGLVNDMRRFDAAELDQTVKRFLALGPRDPGAPLEHVLAPRLATDRAASERAAAKLGLALEAGTVALMPGAEYGPAKQWPIERFAALAARLCAEGRAVWVLGSAKERALGERIAVEADAPGVHNLCGATTLTDVVDLLAAVPVAVSNDSGLMHVAAASGTHVVAIYGSSTPDFTPPLTDASSIHYLRLDCSPCFERHCPLGHLNCLRGISVDDVHASVARVPVRPPAGAAGTGSEGDHA